VAGRHDFSDFNLDMTGSKWKFPQIEGEILNEVQRRVNGAALWRGN